MNTLSECNLPNIHTYRANLCVDFRPNNSIVAAWLLLTLFTQIKCDLSLTLYFIYSMYVVCRFLLVPLNFDAPVARNRNGFFGQTH